jgi:hypothetical protein
MSINAGPRPLYHRERPGTHCKWGWVVTRAGQEGYLKYRPHRVSIPEPQLVATNYNDWAIPAHFYISYQNEKDTTAKISKFLTMARIINRTLNPSKLQKTH